MLTRPGMTCPIMVRRCRCILRRQHAAPVTLRQQRPHPLSEAGRFRIVQIARQAERRAPQIDELLQRIGALPRVAHDDDPGAGPHPRHAGPKMRADQLAMLARKLLHALVGDGIGVMGADEPSLRLGHVAHQFMRRIPCLGFGLAAEDL